MIILNYISVDDAFENHDKDTNYKTGNYDDKGETGDDISNNNDINPSYQRYTET